MIWVHSVQKQVSLNDVKHSNYTKHLDSSFADILYIDRHSDIGIRLESLQ